MLTLNSSLATPSVFLLTGIPGLEAAHAWFSKPLCSMFLVTLMSNTAVIQIVVRKQSLHELMYIFLAMLALNNIIFCLILVLKMLAIFWWDTGEIPFEGCLTQMVFIHALYLLESAILLAMPFDRYIAICEPVRYTSILTTSMIGKMGVGLVARSTGVVTPGVFLLKRLLCCRTNVIHHTSCENMGIAKLACADITINSVYGLMAAFLTVRLDAIFNMVSYILILTAVLRLPSQDTHLKAFGTCGAHIFIFSVFYTLAFFSFFTHRFGPDVLHSVHIILGNLYLLVPPTLNPIVYGVKTKEIWFWVLGLLCQKQSVPK